MQEASTVLGELQYMFLEDDLGCPHGGRGSDPKQHIKRHYGISFSGAEGCVQATWERESNDTEDGKVDVE
ncbi:unnamed protein product [Caretta caretta]